MSNIFKVVILIFLSFQFSGCDIKSLLSSVSEEEMKKQIEELKIKVNEQEIKIKEYEQIIKNDNKKVSEMFN